MVDIIATIGPASTNLPTLKSMVKEGMTIARINMKYASRKELVDLRDKLDGLGVKLLIDILNLKQYKLVEGIKTDYIALAFTESSSQINELKQLSGGKTLVVAKIENKKGVRNIMEIIRASDGLMVARGDLGRNVKTEELPIYQKRIIRKCNKEGKYVITATEMLHSMVSSKKPTKAEASDVANAVIDGSNALMLSEETAIGKHPVLAVRTMKSIIDETKKYLEGLD